MLTLMILTQVPEVAKSAGKRYWVFVQLHSMVISRSVTINRALC